MKLRVGLGVAALLAMAGCGGDDFDTAGPAGPSGPAGPGSGGEAGSASDASSTSAGGAGASVGGAGGATGGAGGVGGSCVDQDGDGYDTCQADCDDADPTSFPSNPEVCGDGKDNDCLNGADDVCQGIGTYVSGALGLDTNPGTQAMPVQTIAQGIANALVIGQGVDVYVDHGHYPEKVTLAEGVSLLGGYDAADMWTRDPANNDTAILNIDAAGVVAGDAITRQTELDGFRVEGLDGATGGTSAAITLQGGTPTISNNRVNGGNVNGADSVGIHVLAPSNDALGALIAGNTVVTGSSSNECSGIRLGTITWPAPPPGAIAEVVGNAVAGGTCKYAVGIANWAGGSGTLVFDNDVSAGSSVGGDSWGIASAATGEFDSNRVNVDQAAVGACTQPGGAGWCGGIVSISGTGAITNNVAFGVVGSRVAALMSWEGEMPAGSLAVSGNYLDGGGQQSSDPSSLSTAIGLRTAFGVASIVGRFRNNILLGGSNKNRYGVYEDKGNQTGQHAKPEALENNDFWFPALPVTTVDVFYRDWDGTVGTQVTTIAGVNTLPGVTTAANFSEDPMIGAGFHLLAGSPCIDVGTAAEAPAADFEGDGRPMGAGVDVGPDEAM